VELRVADRNGLRAGGLVPLVLGVPAMLALIALGLRARPRRRTVSAPASPD
jgi:hypothetical protein